MSPAASIAQSGAAPPLSSAVAQRYPAGPAAAHKVLLVVSIFPETPVVPISSFALGCRLRYLSFWFLRLLGSILRYRRDVLDISRKRIDRRAMHTAVHFPLRLGIGGSATIDQTALAHVFAKVLRHIGIAFKANFPDTILKFHRDDLQARTTNDVHCGRLERFPKRLNRGFP
jgi:hypothetical protein